MRAISVTDASAVAPVGVAVAVTLEGSPELCTFTDVDRRLGLEGRQVLVDPAVDGQRDDVPGGLADPGLVEQLAGPVQPDHLVVAQLPRQVTSLGVRGHPPTLGQVPVEQVHDAVERLGRRHGSLGSHRVTLPSPRRTGLRSATWS